MSSIQYLTGDATNPQSEAPSIIAHVCNDRGGWGKGFVLAISKRWPEPEQAYREWYAGKQANDFTLGALQITGVENDLWVANMVAQAGYKSTKNQIPLRYDALENCLGLLAGEATSKQASVHMPRIGCGLAGGTWDEIDPSLNAL